jgi:hypothetical protein
VQLPGVTSAPSTLTISRCSKMGNRCGNFAVMPRSTAALKAVPVHYTNKQIIDAATGRWGEAANEVKVSEPYTIKTPDGVEIVIQPLTRRRRKALKAAQAAYMMLGAQMIQVQQDQTADQGTIDRIQKLIDEADERYNRALFGDAYEPIVEYYEDLQEEFWDAMYQNVHDVMVNRVELPEDICSKCGQKVDTGEEGGEGKGGSSSTSSTDTGTKSTETSAKS